MKRALIVVAKQPQPGQTKTRLTPPLSPEQAAAFYRCLMLDTFQLMDRAEGTQPVIAYAPDEARDFFRQAAPPRFSLSPQRGHNLGQRLDHVLREHLEDGFEQAVVMNSDGPTLPLSYLEQAFTSLDDPLVDVVLGPSDDGGYYLIGLKRPCSALFELTMSTPHVLEETLALAEAQGLVVACLPPWHDVDVWEDILCLVHELAQLPDTVASHTRHFIASGGIRDLF